MNTSVLEQFHRALAGGPLELGDPRMVPMPWGDLVPRLARRIVWTPAGTVQLVAGFRGAGKTTLLRRLQGELSRQGQRAIYCDFERYLDLCGPIDVSDALGIIREITAKVEAHVVIFDSLENIRAMSHDYIDVHASIEELIIERAERMRIAGKHVVMTIPPWLRLRAPGVVDLYDAHLVLPCVADLDWLRTVVERRGDWRRVFARQDDFDHVLRCFGGRLGELFRAIQELLMCAAERGGPLDRETIERELFMARDQHLPIAHADARWLIDIVDARTIGERSQIPRAFDTLLSHDGEWFRAHPLVRADLDRLALRAA